MFAIICLDDDKENPLGLQGGDVNLRDECFSASGVLHLCYHPSKILDSF